MRPWYRGYLPGWFVWGGGGGSGSGTVQTDGVTIQGDGSAGNKIAIKAVQNSARLTGAGTVASKLDIAGWPITLYSDGTNAVNEGGPPANKLAIFSFFIPSAVQFDHLAFATVGGEAVNGDIGLYSSAGVLVANLGAQVIGAGGLQSKAIAQGLISIQPDNYILAYTGVSGTLTLAGDSVWVPVQNANFGASVGGALPASIVIPATSIQQGRPMLILYKA